MKNLSFFMIASGLTFVFQISSCKVLTIPQNDQQVQGCPVNMMPYPVKDKPSDFICDCYPGFVYFPENESCHELFKQGLCPEKHYVYIGPKDENPSCEKNLCLESDQVPYDGQCHELGATGGPCLDKQVLSVNVTSLQLECSQIGMQRHIIDASRHCPRGSLRDQAGMCQEVM